MTVWHCDLGKLSEPYLAIKWWAPGFHCDMNKSMQVSECSGISPSFHGSTPFHIPYPIQTYSHYSTRFFQCYLFIFHYPWQPKWRWLYATVLIQRSSTVLKWVLWLSPLTTSWHISLVCCWFMLNRFFSEELQPKALIWIYIQRA